jgi:serine/threonine protein kinase
MVKIIKGKYKRIPKKFSKHLSDMVHWLLTKSSNKRPSIEDVILHPLFQKKAVQLRIPLPIRPKEIILPGDALKVTGGCFDTEDFKLTQSLTSDSKPENIKKKLRSSDLNKNSPIPVTKEKPNFGKRKGMSRQEESKISKSVR